LNYLHWIEDLLERKIDAIGIDIGAGCSCIHALLAVRLNPQWTMFVSEIDPLNYRMAIKNVEQNGLQDRIHGKRRMKFSPEVSYFSLVIQMDPSGLFDGLIDRTNQYDFLMCNPPFFSDVSEYQGLTHTRQSTRPSANSINTAADIESIYDQGGEVEFVKRMINESRTYATNVR
jgi:23S rRNA (adenine1618-N6)-methyltransferase